MSPDPNDPDAIPEITPTDLRDRLQAGDELVLVDVREPFEREIADLPEQGQLRIPLRSFQSAVEELDPETEIVLYCRSGARSGNATKFLMANGFDRVWNLEGGVMGWRRDIDPSLREY